MKYSAESLAFRFVTYIRSSIAGLRYGLCEIKTTSRSDNAFFVLVLHALAVRAALRQADVAFAAPSL